MCRQNLSSQDLLLLASGLSAKSPSGSDWPFAGHEPKSNAQLVSFFPNMEVPERSELSARDERREVSSQDGRISSQSAQPSQASEQRGTEESIESGAHNPNPFWSEAVQGEFNLRRQRPAFLDQEAKVREERQDAELVLEPDYGRLADAPAPVESGQPVVLAPEGQQLVESPARRSVSSGGTLSKLERGLTPHDGEIGEGESRLENQMRRMQELMSQMVAAQGVMQERLARVEEERASSMQSVASKEGAAPQTYHSLDQWRQSSQAQPDSRPALTSMDEPLEMWYGGDASLSSRCTESKEVDVAVVGRTSSSVSFGPMGPEGHGHGQFPADELQGQGMGYSGVVGVGRANPYMPQITTNPPDNRAENPKPVATQGEWPNSGQMGCARGGLFGSNEARPSLGACLGPTQYGLPGTEGLMSRSLGGPELHQGHCGMFQGQGMNRQATPIFEVPNIGQPILVMVDGRLREARVNSSGGLEVVPQIPNQGHQHFYVGETDPFEAGPFGRCAASPFKPPPAPPPGPPQTPQTTCEFRIGPCVPGASAFTGASVNPDYVSTPRLGTTEPAKTSPMTPGGTRLPPGDPPPTPPRPPPSAPYDPGERALDLLRSALGVQSEGLIRQEEVSRSGAKLPALEPGSGVAACVAGDWLAQITPTMRALSNTAWQWWDDVWNAAHALYQKWLQSSPADRLLLKAVQDGERPRFETTKWARVEQHAIGLLVEALPKWLQTELIANRQLDCTAIVFRILTAFQPGGPQEKAVVLQALTSPATGKSAPEALKGLRMWVRLRKRADELEVAQPDPSLLVAAIDLITAEVLKQHPQASFRLASYRHAEQVDVLPTAPKVSGLAQMIQAELEAAVSSSTDSTKRQRVARMSEDEGGKGDRGKGDAKGSEKGGGKESKGKSNASGAKATCWGWGTATGCRFGSECQFAHGELKKGICWGCGSTEHTKPSCPRPGGGAADSAETPFTGKGDGGNGGKTKGKGKKGEKGGKPKSNDRVAKAQGEGGATSHEEAGTEEKTSPPAPSQAELLKDCADLLKSMKVKRMFVRGVKASGGGKGLLDGGATSCLRQGTPEERAGLPQKCVDLAVGQATLYIKETGVLLTAEPIAPIVSKNALVKWLGCEVRWTKAEGCTVYHPKRGWLDIDMSSGCPEVSESLALQLIEEIERAVQHHDHVMRCIEGKKVQDRFSESRRRACESLREGSAEELKRWIAQRFPTIPERLVERMVTVPSTAASPWNRRIRRSWDRKDFLILHLCCGTSRKMFDHLVDNRVGVVTVDIQEDLLSDDTLAMLLHLIVRGKVIAVVSGAPCRTLSGCRHRDSPGAPKPVRARYGEEFWGLQGLSEDEQAAVDGDSLLWLRSLVVYITAQYFTWRVHECDTWFGFEHPEDPAVVWGDESDDQGRSYPSIWASEVMSTLAEECALGTIGFDQGPLGHAKRKPTRMMLHGKPHVSLMQCRGEGVEKIRAAAGLSLGQSGAWAAWAPGLKAAIVDMVQGVLVDAQHVRACSGVHVAKVKDHASFTQHVLQDHMPFRNDCRHCLAGRARDRRHLRQQVSEAYTLHVDMSGPHKEGNDQLGSARYVLIGNFTVPVLGPNWEDAWEAKDAEIPEGPWEHLDLDEKVDVPQEGEVPAAGVWDSGEEEAQASEEGHEPSAGDKREEEECNTVWARIRKNLQMKQLKMENLVMAEPLASKKHAAVLEAVAKMVTRIRAAGYPVVRLHSDCGGEFMSKGLRKWCALQSIYKTTGEPDVPQTRGRIENAVGRVKGLARSLLQSQPDLPITLWPHAVRHAAERLWRISMAALGKEMPPLIPFGTKVIMVCKREGNMEG